jgi:hypothetical protein
MDKIMTPPEMQGQGSDATTPGASPAVSLCIVTLQNRPDFLRAASASAWRVFGAGARAQG